LDLHMSGACVCLPLLVLEMVPRSTYDVLAGGPRGRAAIANECLRLSLSALLGGVVCAWELRNEVGWRVPLGTMNGLRSEQTSSHTLGSTEMV
jgi:hypothetical protein